MLCWLTKEFDGGGKLINVVQFRGKTEVLLISGGVIDETYNFRGVIVYLLIFLSRSLLMFKISESILRGTWRKIECLQNKAADKIFDFLSLDHYEFTHESVIRLLPRSVESESWKLETGISITAKQASSSKASSKSTRTVLLQNSVLAKESEVSES